eukprot:CAMPEP_0202920874 /NCGR_PEP_ID=MMETSP1392-20130828/77086_1 /ASSEMBLY_ACC=CAM_ASM_000868 /TAXON_ID=225041 /ORGANISM="Chlamydomonas chlamydogama, Strain SAG 11-48b" /LENGTH=149 /DNA_ID=CAMNT_0049614393 /DNA_START=2106 /DNA_END=2556 /DNA_ORIENTATION=-
MHPCSDPHFLLSALPGYPHTSPHMSLATSDLTTSDLDASDLAALHLYIRSFAPQTCWGASCVELTPHSPQPAAAAAGSAPRCVTAREHLGSGEGLDHEGGKLQGGQDPPVQEAAEQQLGAALLVDVDQQLVSQLHLHGAGGPDEAQRTK